MDMSAPILRAEGSSSPQFGPSGRPSFGLARDQGKRIEVTFALRPGGQKSHRRRSAHGGLLPLRLGLVSAWL